MIDINRAIKAFEKYISSYDQSIPSIHLKVVHTYEVMKCSDYLCNHLHLNEDDTALASLIALLHDIGRFEQWMQYESFADYKTVDHALFSSKLLFEDGLIREFVSNDCYDDIIKSAIEQHNKYKVDEGFDERTLLFIHLIRDADKLDNFRVKEEERLEDLLFASYDEICSCEISDVVYDQMKNEELVFGPNRKTYLDFWLSYIAFIYDLYFIESVRYIDENNWVERSFERLRPNDKDTLRRYLTLKEVMFNFVERKLKDEKK